MTCDMGVENVLQRWSEWYSKIPSSCVVLRVFYLLLKARFLIVIYLTQGYMASVAYF